MPRLPAGLWVAGAGVALLLLALCAAVVWAVLRAPMREQVARWSAWQALAIAALPAIPWLVATFATIQFHIRVQGLWQLLGWVALALLTFALLVLLPVAVTSAVVWWCVARRRGLAQPAVPELAGTADADP